ASSENAPSPPASSVRSSSSAASATASTERTWPPSNAISIRTRSSTTADHLREHPVEAVRVDERDFEAEQPAPGLLVDQLRTFLGELPDGLADVGDLVGNVVHAGPALGQELPDRRLLAERSEQLDAAGADAQGSGLHALVGDSLAMLDLGPEQALVGRDGLVEVL